MPSRQRRPLDSDGQRHLPLGGDQRRALGAVGQWWQSLCAGRSLAVSVLNFG